MATQILRMPGKFRITLPDGSELRDCEHRKYGPDWKGEQSPVEWYVFHGKQFSKGELTRWGATISREPETGRR